MWNTETYKRLGGRLSPFSTNLSLILVWRGTAQYYFDKTFASVAKTNSPRILCVIVRNICTRLKTKWFFAVFFPSAVNAFVVAAKFNNSGDDVYPTRQYFITLPWTETRTWFSQQWPSNRVKNHANVRRREPIATQWRRRNVDQPASFQSVGLVCQLNIRRWWSAPGDRSRCMETCFVYAPVPWWGNLQNVLQNTRLKIEWPKKVNTWIPNLQEESRFV